MNSTISRNIKIGTELFENLLEILPSSYNCRDMDSYNLIRYNIRNEQKSNRI